MDTDRKWVIVRVDGKIAAISADFRALADIAASIAEDSMQARAPKGEKRRKNKKVDLCCNEIKAEVTGFEEVWQLRRSVRWDDLMLFGTDFQKKVWRKLWELTHPDDSEMNVTPKIKLLSYSDFADLCQNRAGVRAVAHAIGMNPLSVVIPCHLIVPKESIDKIKDIHKKAESTIFKGDDLCLESIIRDNSIDFGEYSLGRELKRRLIEMELFLSGGDHDDSAGCPAAID